MATISDARSVQATLSGTTVDTVSITQFYDGISISNQDATTPLTVTWDGTVPTTGLEGTNTIPPQTTVTFRDSFIRNQATGVAGGTTTTAPHQIKVLGNGNLYGLEGVSGQ